MKVSDIKADAMKNAFEKMTGVSGAWTNPSLTMAKNGFIQGWEQGILWLAEQHKIECGEERPIQNWIKAWGRNE